MGGGDSMLKRCIALFILLYLLSTATAVADVVIATETGRGEYENGRFTPGKPEFRYRFELDEAAGRAKLTEITRLNTGALIQLSVDYVIIAAEDASATSSILVNKDRRGQKILTLVGKPGNLAIETILLGEKFFEYSKASSGRFYLATGSVKRARSVQDDTQEQLRR
jgi:hypothetical protein